MEFRNLYCLWKFKTQAKNIFLNTTKPLWNYACGSMTAFFYMARKVKYHLIKSGRSYTVSELGRTINRHVRTVQEWIKKGLPVIDRNSKPYLISGYDAKLYLKQEADLKKTKLKDDEIYCLKCRQPRRSLSDELNFTFTGKLIGEGQKQIIVTGVCSDCDTSLQRFSSEKDVTKIFNMTISCLSVIISLNIQKDMPVI